MLANNRCLSATSGRVARPSVRQPMRPAELSQWYRAYVAVPIDIAVKLLVLGIVLSFAARTTTHESYHGVEHDKWHASQQQHARR
jgi:hypothetical protein